MSTKLVKDEILRFLTSTKEEVLCIRGKWGTDKTWTWRDMLISNRSKIALKKYAYVSLFGLNSLAQVRSQVFQNTIDTNQIGKDFSLEDMEASVKASWGWAKRGLALVHRLGAGSDDMESALSLLALSARNQIICIDDLERKGKDLDTADVLGYASQLKDERKCKVVFLLNEEGLDKKNRDAYDAYLEKVVDVSLLFAPTPLESVGIALKGADEASELTRKYCLMLGLENVRVITKIHKAVTQLEALLKDFPQGVFENVVASTVLFGWTQHQPDIAPTMDFLHSYGRLIFGAKEDDLTEQQAAWKRLLEGYPFNGIDAFDLEIVKGLASGYFSPDTVAAHADELNKRIEAQDAMNRWQAAWEMWRYSFTSPASTVTRTIADAFIKDTAYHTNDHLNTLYDLCISMGEPATANQVLEHFLDFNKSNVEAFNVYNSFYHGADFHIDVKAALAAAYTAAKPKPSFEELLISLSNTYNSNTLEELDKYTDADFEKVFLSYEGEELKKRIVGVTDLRRIGNPSPEVTSVVGKVNAALISIAATSPINKERVEKTWRVKLPPPPAPVVAAPVAAAPDTKAAKPRARPPRKPKIP